MVLRKGLLILNPFLKYSQLFVRIESLNHYYILNNFIIIFGKSYQIIQFLKYGKISLYTKYKEILRWKKN